MKTRWTPQQEAFISALKSGASSIVLEAVAGSGKTTTMVGGVNSLGLDAHEADLLDTNPNSHPAIACAFNKRIADTLAQVMPDRVLCKTMNALGHGAWMKAINQGRANLDAYKNYKICKDYDKDALDEFPDLPKLMGLAKAFGIVPTGARQGFHSLQPDDDFVWDDLIEDYEIEGNSRHLRDLARRHLKTGIDQAFNGVIDFDDQLYMSTLWSAPIPKAELIMVDEAQDISPIQRQMLHQMRGKNGRIAAVGDRNQAIYGFRGADYTSMDKIKEETSAIDLPLTVSFRCPKSIVHEAKQFVSHIEAHPDAPAGIVRSMSMDNPDFKPGDTIICRNNAPIISLAFNLIAAGIKAKVLGRDIGKALKTIIKREASGDGNLELSINLIESWASSKIYQLTARMKIGQAEAVRDKVESIYAIASNCRTNSVRELNQRIDEIFDRKVADVTLSTIHKAKGLEWDKVYWYKPELVPAKWAKDNPAQLRQEHNLAYVAITRAKHELVYLHD